MIRTEFELDIPFIDEFLNRFQNFGFSGTVLLAKGDNIQLNKAYGYQNYEKNLAMKNDSVISSGSISKQFTSTAILKLVEEGKLELHSSLSNFFKNVPSDKTPITVDQILTHRSGLISGLGDDFDQLTREEFLAQVLKSELQSIPGETYSYSNAGYTILALIIEEISGVDYFSYINGLLKPLGITNYGWFGDKKWNEGNSVSYYKDGENTGSVQSWVGPGKDKNKYWNLVGNGGICLSSFDLYKWIFAVMSGKLISLGSVKKMTTPSVGDYAYGWRRVESPVGTLIRHNGASTLGVNSVAQFFKDIDTYVIIMSNVIQNGFGFAFQFEAIFNIMLEGKDVNLPPNITRLIQKNDVLPSLSENPSFSIYFNKLNQVFAGIEDQDLLNEIFNISEAQKIVFERNNAVVELYGNSILSENFDEVFKLTTKKGIDQSRINFIRMLKTEMISEIVSLDRVSCAGTIPGYDYHAMSILQFHGSNGMTGFPVIWANDDEILGIRPIFTKYPLSFIMGMNNKGHIIGFNGLYNLSVNFSNLSNQIFDPK